MSIPSVGGATVIEDVRVNFDANLQGLNNGFRQARGRVDNFSNRAIRPATATVAALNAAVVRLAATLGALAIPVGVIGSLSKMRSSLSETTELLNQIEDLNISEGLFRGLGLAAEQAGISTRQLESALARFNRRVSRLNAEQGTLFSSLNKTNRELISQLQQANDLDTQLALFADAVNNAANEQEQLRLVSAAFGNEGEKLIRLFRDGSVTFEELRREVRELGLVMGRDNLTASRELSDAMDRLQSIVGTRLTIAFSNAAVALGEFFGILETRRVGTIEQSLNQVNNRILEARQELEALQQIEGNISLGPGNASSRERRRELADELSTLGIEFETLQEELGRATERMNDYSSAGSSASSATNKLTKDQSRLSDGVTEVSKNAQESASFMQETFRIAAGGIDGVFQDLVRKGEINFQRLTESILANLAQISVQMAILEPLFGDLGSNGSGGGIIGGLFGSLTGRQFGGSVMSGQPVMVGERGPEVFMPRTSGAVANGASNVNIEINNYSNARVRQEPTTDMDGNRTVKFIVSEVGKGITRGELDGPQRSRFGNRPKGIIR